MTKLLPPTGGWGSPKIDVKSPVLYLPLWHPRMVARGGAIVNGTGTMDTSPTTLAVGANTITATGAGTFIIYCPEGGTCSSGTATITGSPVTLNSGTTTVTTGVTTGNFTVTSSNIIRSKDNNNHACTVIGATWGSQGRTFDGDDYITAGNAASLQIASEITIEAWFYPSVTAAHRTIVGRRQTNTNWQFNISNSQKLYWSRWSATVQLDVSANTAMSTLAWHHGVVTYSTTAGTKFYLDGQPDGTNATGGDLDTNATATTIGSFVEGIGSPFEQIIGEVRIYNRALSAVEILQNYNAPKWRYT